MQTGALFDPPSSSVFMLGHGNDSVVRFSSFPITQGLLTQLGVNEFSLSNLFETAALEVIVPKNNVSYCFIFLLNTRTYVYWLKGKIVGVRKTKTRRGDAMQVVDEALDKPCLCLISIHFFLFSFIFSLSPLLLFPHFFFLCSSLSFSFYFIDFSLLLPFQILVFNHFKQIKCLNISQTDPDITTSLKSTAPD